MSVDIFPTRKMLAGRASIFLQSRLVQTFRGCVGSYLQLRDDITTQRMPFPAGHIFFDQISPTADSISSMEKSYTIFMGEKNLTSFWLIDFKLIVVANPNEFHRSMRYSMYGGQSIFLKARYKAVDEYHVYYPSRSCGQSVCIVWFGNKETTTSYYMPF